MSSQKKIEIGPQPGPQTLFISTPADIAIYGGSAGSGKSYGLLLEPLRHYFNPHFGCTIFRRTTKQVRNQGGLWDTATRLYSPLNPNLKETTLEIDFKTGMSVQFNHIEYESDIYNYQGAQIPLLGFDELTHFTERMFFYLLSRNRSMSGVPGYVRATCNPDPDSWVRTFIDWWIGEDGYPIKERAGVLKWFIKDKDTFIWDGHKFHDDAKSVTFIPALVEDNQILLKSDPAYISNLKALPYVDRMRLLHGNWNIKPSAGSYFKKEYFEIVDAMPAETMKTVRYWDRAASEDKTADWTAGVKMHRAKNNLFFISDVCRLRGTPLKVEQAVLNTAKQDTVSTIVGIEQDPGQAGVSEAGSYTRLLAGFIVKLNKVTTDKETRAKPLSAQCEAGNVKLVKGPWIEQFLNELQSFPDSSSHDDQVDSASGAFNLLMDSSTGSFTKSMVPDTVRTIAPAKGNKDLW